MALMLKTFNVTSHVNPYLHVHHSRCLLCMSVDVILAGWQETFRSTASRLAADLKVSCQPAGRRHFLIFLYIKKWHWQGVFMPLWALALIKSSIARKSEVHPKIFKW